ncbi:MAG: SDR family oxidoreductase [Gammaproteobacteria bacterium]|nr:SDR family oxidoreductase [Gammaproteobacteria bacterium]
MSGRNLRVLIAGATGYLGRHLITAYANAGYRVRALARNRSKLDALAGDVDEVFTGEVTMPATLAGCCEGVDLVVSALGITRQRDGVGYEDVDYQANRDLLAIAIDAGVPAFAYVHVLNASALQGSAMVRAKSRFAAELAAAPVASTVLCPSGFFADMHEILSMAARGRVYLFGDGNACMSPVHGADLAEICVAATQAGIAMMDVGGPEVFSANQIAELAFATLGKQPRITHVPLWAGKVVVSAAQLFGLGARVGGLEFLLQASNIDMSAPGYGTRRLEAEFVASATAMRNR